MRRRLLACCLCLAWIGFVGNTVQADEYVTHHEHVLGTSLELRIEAASSDAASRIENFALSEIDRLAKVFSRHDDTSELMRWQRGELSGTQLSTELVEVLTAAEEWRVRTGGAFDIRAGALIPLWKQAEATQQLPTLAARTAITMALREAPWTAAFPQQLARTDRLPLSLDAIAKGYILDSVTEATTRQFPNVSSMTIQIGGDLRKIGEAPLPLAIANPRDAGEGARPIDQWVSRTPVAMATSGGYRRFFEIQGRRYSHIFDPRTGFPAQGLSSVSVIAPTAMEADAAATSVSVLGAVDGLRLVESLPGYECLIQTSDGQVITSSKWPGTVRRESGNGSREPAGMPELALLEDPKPANPETQPAEEAPKAGLTVDFTIARAGGGGRYRRPYVAVWLEDQDGFPVKTAVLWIMTEGPGPRWHRDLTRWYRNDRVRLLAEDKELIGTVSSPTRGPGEYQTRFEGVDNDGKPLAPGKYTLCIEAAREHGTYQIIKETIDLGAQPIAKKALKGNTEVSAAAFQYLPFQPAAPKASPAQ